MVTSKILTASTFTYMYNINNNLAIQPSFDGSQMFVILKYQQCYLTAQNKLFF